MSIGAEKNTFWFKSLLLGLPIIYVILGFFLRTAVGEYYLFTIDPEYSYLFNGLNIAQGSLKVWHVDHPGTPLQLLVAIVIRVVHFFVGTEPLVNSVLRNPELYLGAVNITLFTLNAALLFVLGLVTYNSTKNILSGFFLQLTLFVSIHLLYAMIRIGIEQMIIFTMLLMLVFSIKFIYDDSPNIYRYILAFSVIVGLGVSCKIVVAPIFFIPLFLIPGWRKKFFFAFATACFFALFISPVIVYRGDYFIEWIRNLFLHTGKYGVGSSEIVDANAFGVNLKNIFFTDIVFPVILGVTIISVFVYQIPFIKAHCKNKKAYCALLGVTVAIILNIIIVAKHYSYHYLVTSLLLWVFVIHLLFILFGKKLKFKYTNLVLCFIVLPFLYIKGKEIFVFSKSLLVQKLDREKVVGFIKTLDKSRATLIISNDYSSAYKEFAMKFGFFWGGPYFREEYNKALDKIYGNSYVYGWENRFDGWRNLSFSVTELLEKNKRLYLYSSRPELIGTITEFNDNNVFYRVALKKIFSNESTRESVFEIERDEKLSCKERIVSCNAEKTNDDNSWFVGSENILFGNGNTQSNEVARSGKYSSKTAIDSPFGFSRCIGNLNAGDSLIISVWRYKSNTSASVVISSKSIYFGENKSTRGENGWEKITLYFKITQNIANEEFIVYTWNGSKIPAYFDDLEIVKISP